MWGTLMSNTADRPWPDNLRPGLKVTRDAIVVVPGIMGSELFDAETGKTLWGLRKSAWYVRAWGRGDGLEALALTDDELSGKIGRVRAGDLLRFPAIVPILSGIEPYTKLSKALSQVVSHPDAVLGFGYDWRLPVAFNARLLAKAAADHLEKWRLRSGFEDAQLLLVAHSMGGLLCQAIPEDSGLEDVTRAVVTLGTPFGGAAKAALLLNSGLGAPLPAGRLRRLVATMPGIHALLPSYRCVDDGADARRLTPADVGAIGGSPQLAADAFATRDAARPLVNHRALIGVRQPTLSALTIDSGVVTAQPYTFVPEPDGELARRANGLLHKVHGEGDGTVPRDSARPDSGAPMPLAQQHGQLARSPEAIDFVRDIVTNIEADLGPKLGVGDGIGLSAPDFAVPGTPWIVDVTGVIGRAKYSITDLDARKVIVRQRLRRVGDGYAVSVVLPSPGLYRLSVAGGGFSPVTRLVLAIGPQDS